MFFGFHFRASEDEKPCLFISVALQGDPGEIAKADSDGEGDQSSSVLERSNLSRRNVAAMGKSYVQVKQSSNHHAGLGLFAQKQLKAGFEVPCKGPFFPTYTRAIEFLVANNRANFADRIIQVTFEEEVRYLVQTGVTGFVNDYHSRLDLTRASSPFSTLRQTAGTLTNSYPSAHARTCAHAHTHRPARTQTHARTHTHRQTKTDTHPDTHTHTYTNPRAPTCTHTHTDSDADSRDTHTHTQTRTHTRTDPGTHGPTSQHHRQLVCHLR